MIKNIWILVDDRPGNYSQAIGLGEAMAKKTGAKIIQRKISYSPLVRLPNFLRISGVALLDKKSRKNLLHASQEENPDVIIAAGRRSAAISCYLREKFAAKNIHIMNPDLSFEKFDLVLLPKHDRKFSAANILPINGALTRTDRHLLQKEHEKFANFFAKIKKPKIALLLGGSSKHGIFSEEIAQTLGEAASKVTRKMAAKLLVVNSRRSGKNVTAKLKNSLDCDFNLFDWFNPDKNLANGGNPYFAILQEADFIIVTGDSISMCCEVCALGKPVFIFADAGFCGDKHLKFVQNLVDEGYARNFDENILSLEKSSGKILDETRRIADEIVQKFSAN